ncbi:MAG TPA: hypothetical protein VM427_06995 [Patescibacteria group bacterium]|nr:hypothetical protein [Patescibacteria group bacterium]
MNPQRALVRLYPASWRARYGEEFTALLEERPIGPFDVADIMLGALDARLRLRGQRGGTTTRGVSMSLRVGGFAAIIGAALWMIGMFLASGTTETTGDPMIGMGILLGGSAALLVALVGLSAFQARSHPRLAWAAFAVPALGTLASIAGIAATGLTGDDYWTLWFTGMITAFIGSGLFALATYSTAVLSRPAAAALGIGSLLPLIGILAQSVAFVPALEVPVIVAALLAFAGGWAALGVDAIRTDGLQRSPRPA